MDQPHSGNGHRLAQSKSLRLGKLREGADILTQHHANHRNGSDHSVSAVAGLLAEQSESAVNQERGGEPEDAEHVAHFKCGIAENRGDEVIDQEVQKNTDHAPCPSTDKTKPGLLGQRTAVGFGSLRGLLHLLQCAMLTQKEVVLSLGQLLGQTLADLVTAAAALGHADQFILLCQLYQTIDEGNKLLVGAVYRAGKTVNVYVIIRNVIFRSGRLKALGKLQKPNGIVLLVTGGHIVVDKNGFLISAIIEGDEITAVDTVHMRELGVCLLRVCKAQFFCGEL